MRHKSLILLASLVAVGTAAGQARWQRVEPVTKNNTAMAYDSRRHSVVLFGGYGEEEFIGDTWEWHTDRWILRSTEGPSRRSGHVMTYDSRRGVVVLFGGRGPGLLGDTWEWDGARWTLKATTGPTARADHRLVFDRQRGVTLLYGGASDTWTWDGTTWTRMTGPTPGYARKPVLVYDEARARTLYYAGFYTWEWDGAAWSSRILTPSPLSRSDAGCAYDSARGVSLIVGGNDSNLARQDTWSYNGSAWTMVTPQNPFVFGEAAMAYDALNDRCLLVSQSNNHRHVYTLIDGDWTLRSRSPGYHSGVQAGWDSRRGRIVITGAVTNQELSRTLFELDGAIWSPSYQPGPMRRQGHSMVFDQARGVFVCFGGQDSWTLYRDTWTWDGAAWRQLQVTGPLGGPFNAAVYDTRREVVVLVSSSCDGTWEWNGTAWRLAATNGPSCRSGAAIAYDPNRERVVLFGGATSATTSSGETWEWDGVAWSLRASSGPAPRVHAAMTFDPVSGKTIMATGFQTESRTTLDDTWAWDGQAWTTLNARAFPPRERAAMVYSPSERACLLIGGQWGSGYELSDVLRLAPPCETPRITTTQASTAPHAATLAAEISGTGPRAVLWFRDGEPIRDAIGTSLSVTEPGLYTCRVTNDCGEAVSEALDVSFCPADFNGDNFLDFFDYTDFAAAFESGDPRSDFNGDSFLDFFDYADFVQAFEDGC